MPNLRPILLLALAFVAFLLWQAWEEDYGPRRPSTVAAETPGAADTPAASAAPTSDVPTAPANAPTPTAGEPDATAAPVASGGERVEVETDVLRVSIALDGGNVVEAQLLGYPVAPKSEQRVVLLDDTGPGYFVAQSGLVGAGTEAPDHRARFDAPERRYALAGDTLEVPLTWQGAHGVTVIRTLRFARGSYVIEVVDEVRNDGASPWSGYAYRQLQRVSPPRKGGISFTDPEQYSFVGAAWWKDGKFEKADFDEDFARESVNAAITDGWIAMQQHYFFAAWVPERDAEKTYESLIVPGSAPPRYLVRVRDAVRTVSPGTQGQFRAKLYVGPKLQGKLDPVAPGLEKTIDYGLVTFLAEPLFWLLSLLHRLVGNWGWAIVLVTVLVKLALYPLSEAQYRSMAKMRKLQPRMAALKERYGDDRQKYNQAMMELYQKEKINPMGGCLPILVQIPVFLALYYVLLESVELRQAPFVLWIENLSARDPYFVLPVLNGLAMYLGQKLTPMVGMDPVQQKMMQMMPIVFAVMFAFFPAGLVLYWTVNGVLSLAQQWVILRRVEGAKA